MKKLILFLFAAHLLSLVSCSEDEGGESTETYNPVSLTSRQATIAKTANDFSDSFFAAYDKAHSGENYIISPLSLEYALAMIANGTDGNPLAQLMNTMGYDATDLGSLNEFCRVLMTELPKVSNRNKMEVFNNMWYNSNLVSAIYPEFSNALKSNFDASCNPSTTNNVVDEVNGWISSKSKGRVKNCLDKIDPEYHSLIVNVLNFEGFWPRKMKVKNDKFYNADGKIIETDFLVEENGIITHNAEMGYMFDIPYSKGAYRLRIILPKREVSLDDFIANLSEQYDKADHWDKVKCEVSFPKFKCSSSAELSEVVNIMGITDIFDKDHPNVVKIGSTPAYLSEILQAGTIVVDENGTVASSVTVGVKPVGYQPASICEKVDRPFAFEIYESSTGTKLFQGRINNL